MEKIIIAGHTKYYVAVSSQDHPTYLNLVQLAQRGNYWAVVIVKELHALMSGVFKPNVYIHQEPANYGYAVYKMVLPGCTAYIHKDSTGGFYIYRLEASLDYTEQQEKFKKPGLHRITKNRDDDTWVSTPAEGGQIKPIPGRIVAVADQSEAMADTMIDCADAITSASGVGASSTDLEFNGFDLHFTPGAARFGGAGSVEQRQEAAKPEAAAGIHESALLLASAMADAQKLESVRWITQGGGAGIMTQAMQILKNKGVSFTGKEHKIFFSDISTNLVKAEQMARDLGLHTARLTHSRNVLNPNQLLGAGIFAGQKAAWQRYKGEQKHTLLKMSADMVRETSKLTTLPGVVGLGSLASVGISPESLMAPGIMLFALAAGPKIYKTGGKLLQAWLPRRYKKIMEKF